MKKKALALAVAGAFLAPTSYAAQDTSGMQYTSAAEGFYASIRTKFSTEDITNKGASIDASSSRFGVRGSNDLGNGLKGFYQYEAGIGQSQGGNPSLRVGQVGLEGAFGRVWAGSGWVETHNMTYGATDIANNGSGSLSYSSIRPGREDYMVQYRTPDISGFQAALGFVIQPDEDNDKRTTPNARTYIRSGSDPSTTRWVVRDGRANPGVNSTVNTRYILVGNQIRTTRDHDNDATTAEIPYTAADMWDHDGDNTTPEVPAFEAGSATQGAFEQTTPGATWTAGAACTGAGSHAQQEACPAATTTETSPGDDNNVEMWSLAAKYSVQGFTGAFAYSVRPDTAGTYENNMGTRNVAAGRVDDYTAWTARLGYAQNNWYVNGWYGKDNDSDLNPMYDDAKYVSMAAGVAVGKVNMYGVWEKADYGAVEDANAVVGVQYNLGSRTRVWMDYVNRDRESKATAEDNVNIGLRHDF